MPCDIAKCLELVAQKKNKANTVSVNGLKQVSKLKILSVTFQENNRINEHVKQKLMEANRCIYLFSVLYVEKAIHAVRHGFFVCSYCST